VFGVFNIAEQGLSVPSVEFKNQRKAILQSVKKNHGSEFRKICFAK
jgi:hypothetical protein